MSKKDTLENLVKMLNSPSDDKIASAEFFLDVCIYPDDYWIMPDYYYPGCRRSEKTRDSIETKNDMVINNSGFVKESNNFFTGGFLHKEKNFPESITFTEDETIRIKTHEGNIAEIPFDMLCGMFLKSRELGYKKPESLNKIFSESNTSKNWLNNQAKIHELQSSFPEDIKKLLIEENLYEEAINSIRKKSS